MQLIVQLRDYKPSLNSNNNHHHHNNNTNKVAKNSCKKWLTKIRGVITPPKKRLNYY